MTSIEPHFRSVVVSGAAGALGRTVVSHLLALNCRVAALDVDFSNWDVPRHAHLSIHEIDLTSARAVDAAVVDAVDVMKGCDSIVAAAADVGTLHRAEAFPDSDWDHELSVNLSGAFRLVRSSFPYLRDSKDGRIVFVSSSAALFGQPAQCAYAASKAALLGLARTLAVEWGRHHILVNAVVPGIFETPKVSKLSEEVRSRVLEKTSLNHFATTGEVAGAIAFLLSPAARSITGSTVQIDGGFCLNDVALTR
jgi:NAD(P)-dependent dehydrogenase (short-subunit alcohol dehydrogenase family)